MPVSDRVKAYRKAWEAANRDRVNAAKRARRAKNPEKERAAVKAWREKYPEKRRAYVAANRDKWRESYRKWSAANPGKERMRAAMRREAVKRATPQWADLKAMEMVYAEARRITLETGVMHDVDHIVPIRGENVCGLHCEANLQILTEVENARKRNKCQ